MLYTKDALITALIPFLHPVALSIEVKNKRQGMVVPARRAPFIPRPQPQGFGAVWGPVAPERPD